MEQVDAELHGWPLATCGSKQSPTPPTRPSSTTRCAPSTPPPCASASPTTTCSTSRWPGCSPPAAAAPTASGRDAARHSDRAQAEAVPRRRSAPLLLYPGRCRCCRFRFVVVCLTLALQ
ncbi:hypothetical protein HBB16_00450 [Pseudonocardia sp. MCCB 268]|nr:hypothetical protein [Pseudonocardia cytotoxica]